MADPEAQEFIDALFGKRSEPAAPEAPGPVPPTPIGQLSDDELEAQRHALADERARRQKQEETDVFLEALFRPKPGHAESIIELHGENDE